jgi:hypothetical protein
MGNGEWGMGNGEWGRFAPAILETSCKSQSGIINQSNSSAFICVYLRFINSNQYFCKKSLKDDYATGLDMTVERSTIFGTFSRIAFAA